MTLIDVPKQPNPKEVDDWVSDLVGALTDPIIVFPAGGWENDIPERLKQQIPLERLIMNMKVIREKKGVPVGDLEALVYMFPRTMEAPMTSEQTKLYFYCFNEAMKFMRVEVPEELKLKKYEELNSYEMHQLDNLKRFIWDRRLNARKERARGETNKMSAKSSNELDIKPTQQSFF